ncbi:unnamed protein product [Scytosiphon promiscuus]
MASLEDSAALCGAAAAIGVPLMLWAWNRRVRHWYYAWSPIAYPGDAVPNRLERRGRWENKNTVLPQGWKFFSDKESHDRTELNWADSELKLTGVTAGRQSWDRVGDGDESPPVSAEDDLTFNPSVNPNSGDKILRAQQLRKWKGARPDETETPENALAAAKKGFAFFQMLQCDDGHWGGDYGGPMFLMPGLIIAFYITGTPLGEARRAGMEAYLRNHQQVDGGWGTHIECASTMFGTILSYISLRLLGVSTEDPACAKGLKFIRDNGGGSMAPSWAKFWMAVVGVYEWEGINSVPAELWLLPRWFPFHPWRMWCHSRMVYLPMSYLYSTRFKHDAEADPLCMALRRELYLTPYDEVDWDASRHLCCGMDAYSELHPAMRFVQNFLAFYERWLCVGPFRWLRNRGARFAMEYMRAEDEQTNSICIGPVNKAFHVLISWVDGGKKASHEGFQRHLQRVDDYLWVAEDGMKMQGYNGSQNWDTSFAVQALAESELCEEFPESSRKAWRYLEASQISFDERERDKYFRHISKGGWPFSTAAHGWPISDCTGEGLKGVLALQVLSCIRGDSSLPPISEERLYDAVNIILSYQNRDGGWATYENTRGFRWYEALNPSETFGDIMIDYSYAECSCSAMTALKSFTKAYPHHRAGEIKRSLANGRGFIRSIQRPDGSWYGSWGVCFTYGTWFGVEGLMSAGEPVESPTITKAVDCVLAHQNANGGWGESYLASVDKEWTETGVQSLQEDSHALGDQASGVVHTGWAMLTLIASEQWEDREDVRLALWKGSLFLRKMQLPTGDWSQEGITGVFNRSTGITYTSYRNVYPIWALGKYARTVEKMFGSEEFSS